MKFAKIVKGTRARRPFSFPLVDGTLVTCALVPLLGSDDDDVIVDARAHAKARGVENPKDGDPLYERGLWVYTLLRACIDPDSPESAPERFFASAEEILDKDIGLDRDRLALIFEAQQAWQDECAPRPATMSSKEFVGMVLGCAGTPEGQELPFESLRPAIRRTFVRTLISLLPLSALHKSDSGPDSPAAPTSSSGSSAPSGAGEGG